MTTFFRPQSIFEEDKPVNGDTIIPIGPPVYYEENKDADLRYAMLNPAPELKPGPTDYRPPIQITTLRDGGAIATASASAGVGANAGLGNLTPLLLIGLAFWLFSSKKKF